MRISRTRYTVFLAVHALAIATALPFAAKAAPKPTLTITRQLVGNPQARSPDEDWTMAEVRWSATECEQVFILGHDSAPHPPTGFIGAGQYIFVARGIGGTVAQTVTAYPKSRPGPGRWGQIHSLDETFDANRFFDRAVQREFASRKTVAELRQTVADTLSKRGFSSGYISLSKNTDAQVIYTFTYEPLVSVSQSQEEKQKGGAQVRQVAFTIFIGAVGNDSPMRYLVKVKPFVRTNYPRDNDKWADAPVDVALNESNAIAEEVKTNAK